MSLKKPATNGHEEMSEMDQIRLSNPGVPTSFLKPSDLWEADAVFSVASCDKEQSFGKWQWKLRIDIREEYLDNDAEPGTLYFLTFYTGKRDSFMAILAQRIRDKGPMFNCVVVDTAGQTGTPTQQLELSQLTSSDPRYQVPPTFEAITRRKSPLIKKRQIVRPENTLPAPNGSNFIDEVPLN